MRSLISAAIVMACVVGASTPTLAAPHMGAHQTQMQMPIHNGGAPRDHDIGHRHGGRHRHRISSVPFGFFYPTLGTDEIGVPPEDPIVDALSQALPSPAVDPLPCRETGAGGVIVLRGTGCTPEKR